MDRFGLFFCVISCGQSTEDEFQDYVHRGVVSSQWLDRFLIRFELRDARVSLRAPRAHRGSLAEFLSNLEPQGRVLGSSSASRGSGPAGVAEAAAWSLSTAAEAEAEGDRGRDVNVARDEHLQTGDMQVLGIEDSEEAGFQRAMAASMQRSSEDEDVDWAIAASLQEVGERRSEDVDVARAIAASLHELGSYTEDEDGHGGEDVEVQEAIAASLAFQRGSSDDVDLQRALATSLQIY